MGANSRDQPRRKPTSQSRFPSSFVQDFHPHRFTFKISWFYLLFCCPCFPSEKNLMHFLRQFSLLVSRSPLTLWGSLKPYLNIIYNFPGVTKRYLRNIWVSCLIVGEEFLFGWWYELWRGKSAHFEEVLEDVRLSVMMYKKMSRVKDNRPWSSKEYIVIIMWIIL